MLPSRTSDHGPNRSPGPKHPQLISSPCIYVRTITPKKPTSSTDAVPAENRSCHPLNNHNPRINSANGKVCATKRTWLSDRSWKEFTAIAKNESEVFTDVTDHGVSGICGRSLP